VKFSKDTRWHLSTQISAVLVVTCILVALTGDHFVRRLESEYLLTKLSEKHQQTAQLVANTSVVSILQSDFDELDAHLSAALSMDSTLLYGRVEDHDARIIGIAGEEQYDPHAPDYRLEISKLPDATFQHLTQSIEHDGEHIATLHMGWNTNEVVQQVERHVNKIRWILIAPLILLALFYLLSLRVFILAPVRKINDKLDAMAAGKRTKDITQHPLISKEFSFLAYIVNRLQALQDEEAVTRRSLAQSIKKAEAANVTKNEFLGVVSHELRTPINGVLGSLELLLKDKNLSAEQLEQIQVAHSSTDSLLAIISNILDFSNIEAGKLELKQLDFNLGQLVDEVGSMLSGSAKNKGLTLTTNNAPELPDTLKGDPMRVRQVLSNLILNAIKFSDQGTITLETELLGIKDKVATIKVLVRDMGIGISSDVQKDLFSSFVQADTSNTRRHGGTGLGLSISQKLVQAMGGVIEVESELGRGSVFSFTLPLSIVDQEKTKTPTATKPQDLPQLSGKLLLAEDNPVNKMVAMKMLKSFGLEATHASNGRVACELYRENEFDVVLMDIQMPEMDGHEATVCIRQCEAEQKRKQTPIIALTANVLSEDRARCFSSGMNDFLSKPIRMTDLHETLKRWLEADKPDIK
jgi:signal transduction histidine kinase/ActR/RegA family two-component response regulator